MNTTSRNAVMVCAFAFTFGATWPSAQSGPARPLDPAEVAAWRQDLAYMVREMARRHRNLYHTVPPAGFDSAVSALDRRIPTLDRHRIIVELARIVALVVDGHTDVSPTQDRAPLDTAAVLPNSGSGDPFLAGTAAKGEQHCGGQRGENNGER
jgi:hypothetical protein